MKTRRMKLSFTKDELFRASLDLRNSGISMPLMDDDKLKESFNVGTIQDSFGFFGSGNNANTFHPDITIPEHIQPKPEDFVRVPFRLLSATTVGAGTWKATDFSNTRMLRDSLEKLQNKPIYFDHDTELLNWVGIVETVNWEGKKGDVPGGINGLLAIDAKTNPKIARGVLIGSIFSNSVTVEFDWEPSHSFDDPYDFNDKMGTIDPRDGKMVRRIVKMIHNYHETSLVWLGADPYAKLINEDGNLVNIDESSTYNLEKDEVKHSYEKDNKYALSFSMPKSVVGLSKKAPVKKESKSFNNKKDVDMDKDLLILLKGIFGLGESDQLTKEQIESLQLKDETLTKNSETFSKLKSVDDKGEALELSEVGEDTHVIMLKSNLDTLIEDNSKIEELTKTATLAESFIADAKTEVERLYSLSVDNETDETIIKMIQEAEPAQLTAMRKQYTKKATSEFSATCKDCGSQKFDFKSSQGGGDGDDKTEVESASFSDLMEKYDTPSMNIAKK